MMSYSMRTPVTTATTACSQASNYTQQQPISATTPVTYAASIPSTSLATVQIAPNLSQMPPPPPAPPIAPIPNKLDIPVDKECYKPPPPACPQTHHYCINEPPIVRSADQHFNTCNTSLQENNIHIQHNRTIVTNVNRNHHHLHRVVVRENNFHHYLTNNIIRAHDIHHQRIEHVKAEGKTMKDHKETVKVEPVAVCTKGSTTHINKSDSESEESSACPEQIIVAAANEPCVEVIQQQQEPQQQCNSPCQYGQVNVDSGSIAYKTLPPAPDVPPRFDPDHYLSDSEEEDNSKPFNIAPVITCEQAAPQQKQRQKYAPTPRYAQYTSNTPQPTPQPSSNYYTHVNNYQQYQQPSRASLITTPAQSYRYGY